MPLRLQDLWRREEVNDYYLAEQERLKNRMLSRLVHRSDMRNQQCLNIRFIKHPPVRKRPANHGRSKSTESEMDEDSTAFGDPAISPSPPPIPHSPRSESSPLPPLWTPAQEQAALDTYHCALADNYIYDLMRLFASAVRALAMYDCDACLEELDQLPEAHQRSSSVMAMVGRARYEMADYMKVSNPSLFLRRWLLIVSGNSGGALLSCCSVPGPIPAD